VKVAAAKRAREEEPERLARSAQDLDPNTAPAPARSSVSARRRVDAPPAAQHRYEFLGTIPVTSCDTCSSAAAPARNWARQTSVHGLQPAHLGDVLFAFVASSR